MHSQLAINDAVTLMGSDMGEHAHPHGSVSLSGGADDAVLRDWFTGLSDGGEVKNPLEAAPWGDTFGLVTDKFGVAWMFNIAGASAEQ